MSIRLTPEQQRQDPTECVLDYRPGRDPAQPDYIDVGEVNLGVAEGAAFVGTTLRGLVAFSFRGRCIVAIEGENGIEQHPDGPATERYTSRMGHFVVVVNTQGEQVFAEHTAAGSLYPRRDGLVRTADDLENPRRVG